jgi:hypothetical protein
MFETFEDQISTVSFFKIKQVSVRNEKWQFCMINLQATGIGFPPREDLRELLGPDGIPVKDCLLFGLSLAAIGDFI